MTQPEPDRLSAARAALHAALRSTFQRLSDTEPEDSVAGWHADRAHAHLPRSVVTPCGWVEVPTISQLPDAASGRVQATIPVFVALDGEDYAQTVAQDRVLSYGWDALAAVKVNGARVTVQTAGPGIVDAGGTEHRGIVFSVQVGLMRSTWCSQTIITADSPQT